jgi:hypothetical protein
MKMLSLAGPVIVPSCYGQLAAADKVQIPKQGTATHVTYYTSQSLASLDMGDVGNESFQELVGITRNTDGQKLFDQMSVRCLFFRTSMGGKWVVPVPARRWIRMATRLFTTFDAAKSVHTLVGGTGKYKGISGTAPYSIGAGRRHERWNTR